jgi:hypothetical protein
MVRQRGGLQWKQGSDGCIFLPAVECEGQGDIYSTNPDLLSKVVPKGLPDEITENFIEAHYPHVVRGKGVLISLKRCTPRFSEDRNKNKSKNVANKITQERSRMLPCQKIDFTKPQNYTNFVMEKYADETFYKTAKTAEYNNNAEKCWKLLRRALNAAIALVPDNGPWVLGYDFHMNNIFVKMDGEPYTSLADWGRIILIEDPNDYTSVYKGLVDGLQNLQNVGFRISNYFDYPTVPQFTGYIRTALDIVMRRARPPLPREHPDLRVQRGPGGIRRRPKETPINRGQVDSDIRIARLTTLYGMLNSAATALPFIFTNIDFTEFGYDLFDTKNQQEIINAVNKHIKVPGIENYIDLNSLFPFPPPPAMANSLLSPQGADLVNSSQGKAEAQGSAQSQNTLTLSPSTVGSSGSSGSSSTPKKGFFSRMFRMGGNRTRKQKLRRFRSQRTHKFRKN